VFDTGNVLYCENFQFNNGNQPKNKYFIVLKRDEDNLIIGSLPTRTNKVPSFIDTSTDASIRMRGVLIVTYFKLKNQSATMVFVLICQRSFMEMRLKPML
jgi:hypothetical protein